MNCAAIQSRRLRGFGFVPAALVALLTVSTSRATQIPVLHKMGSLHGVLLLRAENGKEIAVGDQEIEVRGDEVHSRLIFRFTDGSLEDETTVFRQGKVFQLLYDHMIQKGPAFKKSTDVTIDVAHGKVTWTDLSAKDKKVQSQQMQLPADLVNGMMQLIVQNFPGKTSELKVSYLILESKPRVVTFTVRPDGTDEVKIGSVSRQAERFNLHIDIGGIAGALAPVFGKQPPDIKMWILRGSVPVFIKMVGPLSPDGPVWTMLLTAPQWPADENKK